MVSNQEEKQTTESDFQVILILKSEVNDVTNQEVMGNMENW